MQNNVTTVPTATQTSRDTRTIGKALNPAAFQVFTQRLKADIPALARVQFVNVERLQARQPLCEHFPAAVKLYLEIVTGQNQDARNASLWWSEREEKAKLCRALLVRSMNRNHPKL